MGPQSFRIVSDWMQNGNAMEYTRSNPEVNRLRLVSPPDLYSQIALLGSLMPPSSLGSCLVRPTFMGSGLFTGILKGYS